MHNISTGSGASDRGPLQEAFVLPTTAEPCVMTDTASQGFAGKSKGFITCLKIAWVWHGERGQTQENAAGDLYISPATRNEKPATMEADVRVSSCQHGEMVVKDQMASFLLPQ